MRKHLYVDGKDLADFGVYISGSGTFNAPEKEVTTYRVPGRNGLVLGADERIENIEVTYPCFIYANFAANMRALRSYLLSRSGYVRIADDYDTTHFRMGFFEAGIDTEPNQMLTAGQFELTFNCQPQRWLTAGEVETTYTANARITNPTLFQSMPLLKIQGYGTVSIVQRGGTGYEPGVDVIILADLYTDVQNIDHVEIDCKSMNAYAVTSYGDYVNVNNYVEYRKNFTSYYGVDAPVLYPGDNNLTLYTVGSGLTNVKITPRYWEV